MVTPLQVFVGWTGENALAYEVCRASILACANIPVEVIPLRLWECRVHGYARPYFVNGVGQRYDAIDGKPFSTDFSFTRFVTPALVNFSDEWVLYCDSDMLFLDDVGKVLVEVEGLNVSVACVQHSDLPAHEKIKMLGQLQTSYSRKNWSSFMLFQANRCRTLSYEYVNSAHGRQLHGFEWVNGNGVGQLSPRWNVLHGLQTHPNPAVIHFTRGTPDMPYRACDDKWSELWWECAHAIRDHKNQTVVHVRKALACPQ